MRHRARRLGSVLLALALGGSAVVLPASLPVSAAVPVSGEQGGLIVAEAEQGATTEATGWSWTEVALAGGGGERALEATPNTGRNTFLAATGPRVDIPIEVTAPGAFQVWVRLVGRTGADDSVHVGIDGTLITGIGQGMTAISTTPVWVNDIWGNRVTTTFPSAGRYTLNLWAREDGVIVDRVLLARDSAYRPSGIGPAATVIATTTTTAAPTTTTLEPTTTTAAPTTTTAAPTTTTTVPVPTGPPVIAVEPEDGVRTDAGGWAWTPVVAPGGRTGLMALPNTGRNSFATTTGPRVDLPVRFPSSGTWYVWVRMIGADGADDSVHVGLNGTPHSLAGIGVTLQQWGSLQWVGSYNWGTRLVVPVPSAGLHTLNVWAREDGVAIERVVLTTDAALVPTGDGPPSSAATTPGIPTAVHAIAGNGSAEVRWTSPASDGGRTIGIYVVDASPGPVSVTVTAPATRATVTGLDNGTTYTFTVRALNELGSGSPSNPSNTVTPAEPGLTTTTTTAPPAPGAPDLTATTVLGGLSNPWDLGFAPDGTIVFTERAGRIAALRPGGQVVTLARRGDANLPRVFVAENTGVTGMALDPSFATNRWLYVCVGHANADGTPLDARVARFRIDDDWSGLSDRTDVLTGLRLTNGRHSSCRPRFGPDGMLWVSMGDAVTGTAPQSPTTLAGKVLRITPAGEPAPGNPGGPLDPRVYTLGHRNPMGLGFHPVTGAAYNSEHGPQGQDEVNDLRPGGNYGWDPAGPGGSYDGYGAQNNMNNPRVPNVILPVWTTGIGATAAPGGMTFLSGAAWRSWDNAIVVARLRGGINVLLLDADGRLRQDIDYTGAVAQFGRLRTPVLGPDGALWLTTDNGNGTDRIVRVVPG